VADDAGEVRVRDFRTQAFLEQVEQERQEQEQPKPLTRCRIDTIADGGCL
jgi:hypothetical protein